MTRTSTFRSAWLAGLAAAGIAVSGGLSNPTASHAHDPTGSCRLVELTTPPGSVWGTVTDIEILGDQPVYYGSFESPEGDGAVHQRAAVWRGLEAEPVLVGPDGYDATIAFDLTATGLVNGSAEDWETGAAVSWVQDLGSGELRIFDTSVGPGPADPTGPGFVRRVNDSGEAVGSVDQGRGRARAERAVGYDSGSTEPWVLETQGRSSWATGINNQGERVGVTEHYRLIGDGRWSVWDATVWDAVGRAHHLRTDGIDGAPRVVNDSENVAGGLWVGTPQTGHVEAAFWPAYDELGVGLGVLVGGAWSEAFGMDAAGRVVGGLDLLGDPENPLHDPVSGGLTYNFAWTEELGLGRVRVLPSLFGQQSTDWRDWYALHVAHATHAGLDQIGAGTHSGFTDTGEPIGAPTVFVNASRCGTDVETTHTPFDVGTLGESHEGARAGARSAGRR